MGEPRWLDEREQRVWRAVIGLHQKLWPELERQLIRDGLSGAEFTLLVPLSEAPDGLLRARDLCRMVGWERSRLSHQVARMEKRGLVVREACADDARGSMIRLTPAGRAAIEAAAPGHVAATRRYFVDLLSGEEIDVLTRVCDRILTALADEKR
jgi:DNA-binding MarR family transcriptional regulator